MVGGDGCRSGNGAIETGPGAGCPAPGYGLGVVLPKRPSVRDRPEAGGVRTGRLEDDPEGIGHSGGGPAETLARAKQVLAAVSTVLDHSEAIGLINNQD